MNAPAVMNTDCPTDNEIAAFIDGRLTGFARSAVIEHLAGCGDCRSLVLDANDFAAMLETTDEESSAVIVDNNVTQGDFEPRRSGWKVALSVAALAAGLFVVFGGPLEHFFGKSDIEVLAEASKHVSRRPVEGRLTGFPYQKFSRTRSGNSEEEDLQTYKVKAEAARIHSDGKAEQHAIGVAFVVVGGPNIRYAIEPLTEALRTAKPEERPAIANDLAVALLARGSDEDVAKAYALVDEQWRVTKTPELAWNRALALEMLGRDAEARTAWQEYLALDPDPQWAKEVQMRLSYLELNP